MKATSTPRVTAEINVNVENEIEMTQVLLGSRTYILMHFEVGDDGVLEVDVKAAGFDSGDTPQNISDIFHVGGNMLHSVRDQICIANAEVLDAPAEDSYSKGDVTPAVGEPAKEEIAGAQRAVRRRRRTVRPPAPRTEGVRTGAAPKRIQRTRTKGWRMPEGAVYVGHPTKWGNPFKAGDPVTQTPFVYATSEVKDSAHAVALYRDYAHITVWVGALIGDLAGHDLACWCPLDQPCHADVLLELANGVAE